MDDLISSFSSSHIGQEAIDLAALQAQLTQTLLNFPSSSKGQTHPCDAYEQPCNTPTTRTPSASFSWGQMMDIQHHVMSRHEDHHRDSDDMEDEQMVEDILVPSVPSSATMSSPLFALQQHSPPRSRSHSKSHSKTFSQPMSSPFGSESSFTATDPFYNAQLQALQNNTATPSVLSQFGLPQKHSPFMMHQQSNYPLSFHAGPPALTIDTHTIHTNPALESR